MTDLPLSERFSSCSFTPVTSIIASFSPVIASEEGAWSAITIVDSSGRSSFLLPLQLACRTKEDVDRIVASKCLQPPPKNLEQNTDEEQIPPSHSLRLEAQCHSAESGSLVQVEGLTILSTTVEGNSVLLETEVIVRAPSQSDAKSTKQHKQASRSHHSGVVKTRLEVTAVLTNRSRQQRPVASGLIALELGGGSRPLAGYATHTSNIHSKQTRLGPLSVDLSMTNALHLSAKSVGGTSHGSTLVSLTMKHSNTHTKPVTITDITLHPGQSRQDALFVKDRSMPGGERSVVDMSKHVKWGYVPQTEPQLPLRLQPHEAYSCIIVVDAMDDATSRTFASPISVTAVVGDESSSRNSRVVVATDAQWTTGRVAVEPSDAFRIEMSLRESSCRVGAPFIVSVKVMNLGPETRDLLLIMPQADTKADHLEHLNPPAVSDVNGYTFGVWGLSGDENGPSFRNRDEELLAVDAAVMLGEVKGQHSANAKVRFVPLQDGTLRVPDFKLYDKVEGKWYSCAHKLCVVAASS